MDRLVHFAKVIGIVWAVVMALYFVEIRLWGFAVGWFGQPPAPLWVLHVLFWTWPVAPAIAALWELTRLAISRRH